jgi:hypothetical protein
VEDYLETPLPLPHNKETKRSEIGATLDMMNEWRPGGTKTRREDKSDQEWASVGPGDGLQIIAPTPRRKINCSCNIQTSFH